MSTSTDFLSAIAVQTPPIRKKSVASLTGYSPILDVLWLGPENATVRELLASESVHDLSVRSPVLLYGPSGVGKTTVAMTLASRWIQDSANRTYTLVHATDFAKSFVRSIDADDMPRFRKQHRECDCLLIDNIHELTGKEGIQDELVETINYLEQRGSVAIFTSAFLPQFINQWSPALTSRLMGGHSVEMTFPAAGSRMEILKGIATSHGWTIATDELQQLNEQLGDNNSAIQLKGMVTRWIHHKKASEDSTAKTHPKIIESFAETHSTNPPNAMDIAKAVAREMQLTLELLKGPSRKASVVRGRGLAMFLIRQWTDISYQSIGSLFGSRDHTTVMHACKKIEEDLQHDPDLVRSTERIKQKLL